MSANAIPVADRASGQWSPVPAGPGELSPPSPQVALDELAARRDLRRQIARLERALGRVRSESFPRQGIELRVPDPDRSGGRVLGLRELERTRDAMVDALSLGSTELEQRRHLEQDFRRLITEMERDPAAHRWERVSNVDIGEPGCKHWHSRPRFGLLGALMGWWRVKVSSGCPLATGAGPLPSPPSDNHQG